MRQADVVTAYLNADMPDEVYIKLPKICGDDPSMVRRLYKALYGHLKARQLWNRDFVGFTSDEGFNATSRDECLFFRPKPYFLLILYVDDLLGASIFFGDGGKSQSCTFMDLLLTTKYIKELASKFHLPAEVRPTTPIRADFYSLLETAIHTQVITEMPYKE